MKPLCKIILQYYLKIITKIVIFIHRPMIIAVAGSVNKTFIRDAIKESVVTAKYRVRSNPKNFNTEIGLPLAILNIGSGYNSYKRWLPVVRDAFYAIFQKDFPECLVLELGVARRGDMRYLLSLVSPRISVITDITQRYVESFAGMDHLVGEYAYLVKRTAHDGRVFLNRDNKRVRLLKKYSHAKVISFGLSSCDGLSNCGIITNMEKKKNGINVKMCYGSQKKEVHIPRFGTHHALGVLIGWIVCKEIDTIKS